jgi:acyl transferase domain-containing protein
VGYTAPSVEGQARVVREALVAANVAASRIGYIEAHGTATELGDPIEVAALAEVFAGGKPGSCLLGALKANLGHADVTAGVAGLIKTALALQAGVIPPTPNFEEANPALGLEITPFKVSAEAMRWPQSGERWAGVSSFGIGGTNVHVVLSQAPEQEAPTLQERERLFVVSARTESALARTRERLAAHLEERPGIDLEAVASTLKVGRRAFEHRFAAVSRTADELVARLRAPVKGPSSGLTKADLVFLFPGQGQQFAGMAAGLYAKDAAFRRTIDAGTALLRDEFWLDLAGVIAGAVATPPLRERMTDTEVAQPLLFLMEYALAARWRALGAEPGALLGHSLGELTAAAVAGVFSFEMGLRLAAERGRLMGQTPRGAMLAVTLPSDALARYLGADMWLAAENTPKVSVVAGLPAAIEALETKLAADGLASMRLASKNAFHSPLMAEAAKAFREKVAAVTRREPQIPWLSNVTGTWIDAAEAQEPQYWANQIVSPVRFARCVTALRGQPRILLEVGPGEILAEMARSGIAKSVALPSVGAENRRSSDDVVFLETAGRMWQAGVDLCWAELPETCRARRVSLPTYPFERERYTIMPAPAAGMAKRSNGVAAGMQPAGSKKQDELARWFSMPAWQSAPPVHWTTAGATRPWLVLLDRAGLGEILADRLTQRGATVFTVAAAGAFERKGTHFAVDPANRADYDRLWQELGNLAVQSTGVIDLWTAGVSGVNGFDALVVLLQTAQAHQHRLSQIDVVTDRLEQVADEAVGDAASAEVCGLLRVLALEFPGTHCRTVDVDLATEDPGQIADQLAAELQAPGAGGAIAYRGRLRWQKGWTPAPLTKAKTSIFRKGGAYLITGGAGGVGYELARHLLREYGAHVTLTGRRSGEEVRQRVVELEAERGEALYTAADVTDAVAMAQVLDEMRRQRGRIDGVIHAAGLAGGRMLAGLDLVEAAAIRAPKVHGSTILAELLQNSDVDFLLFCSSINAVFPAPGLAAYAAASEFQNALARRLRQECGMPAVAIDFDAWREVGMAAHLRLPEGFEELQEERMRTAMTPAEGIEVVERVLAGWTGPQILVSTVDLSALGRMTLIGKPSPASPERVIRATDDRYVDAVVEIWSELLANPKIGPNDNFFELGGHSLLGTMVLSRVRERCGVELTLRTLFEAPTPQDLAEQIRLSGAGLVDAVLASREEREEFEI